MAGHRIYPRDNTCPRCKATYVQRDGKHRYCTLECSVAVAMDNAAQLHNHSGPAWEKWHAAMVRFLERGIGVPQE